MAQFEAGIAISYQQHGFKRGFYMATQLLYTLIEFANVLDRMGQMNVIFLWFRKRIRPGIAPKNGL